MKARRMKLMRLVTVLIVVGGFLAFPMGARGQAIDIGAVPAKTEFQLRPGTEQTQKVKIHNRGSEKIRVVAYTEDYFIDPNNQFTFMEPGSTAYSAAQWVTFSESEFYLEPGTFKEVEITLKIPGDAAIGGYASLAIFEGHHLKEQEAKGVVTVGRIGIPLLVTVAVSEEEIEREGVILSLEVEKESWVFLHSDIRTTATFKNTGNTYLHYRGETTIKNTLFGREYKTDHDWNTALANTERKMFAEVKGGLFGPYTVRVVVEYPPDHQLVVEKHFWVIPWLLILLVLGILACGVLCYFLVRRRRANLKFSRGAGVRRRGGIASKWK